MSHLLTMALMREFPGVELNRLLIDHPEATVVGVKGAKFVVVPLVDGRTAYYAYRQGSLHRLSGAPMCLRKRKAPPRAPAGAAAARRVATSASPQPADPKLATWLAGRSGTGPA
jgi:hypothetical protein